MPNLRETRISLLYAYDSSITNDEEFVLLYDIDTAKSPDFPYWNYEAFKLDSTSDDECQGEFRFYKNDVYDLIEVLGFPETFTCYNGLTGDGTEALCIFLKRFAYPYRYLDMILRFARPVPQLCMTSNMVMDHLYTHWSHLLTSLNQPWLSPDNLETFAINATFQAGGSFAELFWICRWNGQTCFPTRQKSKNTVQRTQKSSRHKISIRCCSKRSGSQFVWTGRGKTTR